MNAYLRNMLLIVMVVVSMYLQSWANEDTSNSADNKMPLVTPKLCGTVSNSTCDNMYLAYCRKHWPFKHGTTHDAVEKLLLCQPPIKDTEMIIVGHGLQGWLDTGVGRANCGGGDE